VLASPNFRRIRSLIGKESLIGFNNNHMSTSKESATIDIAICVDSQIFTRGLVDFLRELLGERARIRIHKPIHADSLPHSGARIIILDALLALPILERLPRDCRSQHIILVSEKSHPGLELEEHADKFCAFFPARADETSLQRDLQSILDCPALRSNDVSACERCPSRLAYLAAALPLSPRELEIFERVGRLQSTADIAESLGISIKTLESHYANMKDKLQLSSSRELLKVAVDWVEGR